MNRGWRWRALLLFVFHSRLHRCVFSRQAFTTTTRAEWTGLVDERVAMRAIMWFNLHRFATVFYGRIVKASLRTVGVS
jgi:hypothetical protein